MRDTDAAAVTVCIIAKDAERTVARAVRSALRALPPDGRVLVFDDGSADDTSGAVTAIRDRRVDLTRSPRSLGIPAARNRLLDAVETRYVAVLDADDAAFPWRFHRQRMLLTRGYDIVFSTAVIIKAPLPAAKVELRRPLSADAARFRLLIENPFWHPSMTTRTALLRSLGGYRDVAAEDYDLYLRAAATGHRLYRDPIPVLLYSRHPAQTTIDREWIASKTRNDLVERAFDQLSSAVAGFVPGWFGWRRAGFPADSVPAGLQKDIDGLRRAATTLPPHDRRALNHLLDSFVRRQERPAG